MADALENILGLIPVAIGAGITLSLWDMTSRMYEAKRDKGTPMSIMERAKKKAEEVI